MDEKEKQTEVPYDFVREQIQSGVITEEDKEADKKMFALLNDVPGFKDYLMRTMARDMKRHFSSLPEVHGHIKGHYSLAKYLYERMVASSK